MWKRSESITSSVVVKKEWLVCGWIETRRIQDQTLAQEDTNHKSISQSIGPTQQWKSSRNLTDFGWSEYYKMIKALHLSLWVVEVCWHGDNCVLDFAAQITLSSFLHFDEDVSTDLTGWVHFPSCLDPSVTICRLHDFVRNVLPTTRTKTWGKFSTGMLWEKRFYEGERQG